MRARVVALLVGLMAQGAIGQVRPLTLENLCDAATKVVVGKVTRVESRYEQTLIVTEVTLAASEHLKGQGRGDLTFKIPGGTVHGTTLTVSEAPRFAQGEEVLVFLRPGDTPCDVYGWFRGKYSIVRGKIRELPETTFEHLRASIRQRLSK